MTIASVIKDTTRVDKDGKCLIYIRITIDRKRSYYSTEIKVLPGNFVAGKITGPNANLLNAKINKRISDLEVSIHTRELSGVQITSVQAKAMLNPNLGGDLSFLPYAEKVISEKKGSTFKRYDVELRALKKHCHNRLSFLEITPVWLTLYHRHLLIKKDPNTCIVAFKLIRNVFNHAIAGGIIKHYPFKDWKFPKYTAKEKGYLTNDEVGKLFNLLGKCEPEIEVVLAFFLLEIHGGLRNSDWGRYRVEDVVQGVDLILTTKKTNTQVRLPVDLMPDLEKIVNYINGNKLKYTYSIQHTNRVLKIIAPLAGIKKRLTTHTARHTFASYLLNSGFNRQFIADALGVTEAIVSTYAHLSSSRMRDEVKRVKGL